LFGEILYALYSFLNLKSILSSSKGSSSDRSSRGTRSVWQMYEILLEHQQELGNGYLAEYADRLGLNVPQFLRDIARGTYLDRINQDIESGIRSG